MDIDKKTKKELIALFKQMLDAGQLHGKYANLTPDEGAYLQTEWRITLEREMKRV